MTLWQIVPLAFSTFALGFSVWANWANARDLRTIRKLKEDGKL